MKSLDGRAVKSIIVIGLFLAILAYFVPWASSWIWWAWWEGPKIIASSSGETDLKRLAEIENTARATVSQTMGNFIQSAVAVGAVIGIAIAIQNAKSATKTAQAALENVIVAQDGRVTERFAKAIDHIGNDKIEVRLGGIYSLERISKDSWKKDHLTTLEILTAFIRERVAKRDQLPDQRHSLIERLTMLAVYRPKSPPPSLDLTTDVQAALTVIGRRRPAENEQPLDLRKTDLRGADLRGAILRNARLQGALLQGADLSYADLKEADLRGANLDGAILIKVNFEGANLVEASLENANLSGAYLGRAILIRAYLRGSELSGADLTGTRLQRADLMYTRGLKPDQVDKAIGDAETRLPQGMSARGIIIGADAIDDED